MSKRSLFSTQVSVSNTFCNSRFKTVNLKIMKVLSEFYTLSESKQFSMQTVQTIHCPNCGSHAERHHFSGSGVVRTQCPACDYLMVTCSRTGRVIEAYAPGIFAP